MRISTCKKGVRISLATDIGMNSPLHILIIEILFHVDNSTWIVSR